MLVDGRGGLYLFSARKQVDGVSTDLIHMTYVTCLLSTRHKKIGQNVHNVI